MKRIATLLCLLIACYSTAWGIVDSVPQQRKHVIVAFDGATSTLLTTDSVRNETLNKLFGQSGLINDGDMLSVVCTAGNAANYEDPIVKTRLRWQEVGANTKETLSNNWDDYVKRDWFTGDKAFSLLSISKSYIIDALKLSSGETEYVDQTFILYVTDNVYGNNDYYGESLYFLNNLVTKTDSVFYSGLEKLIGVCTNVAQQYHINYITGDRIVNSQVRSDAGRFIYFDTFELVPNHQSINLPSVIATQPVIEAKRQAGGDYTFNVDVRSYNETFSILHLDAYGCIESDKEPIYERNSLGQGESDTIAGQFNIANPYTKLHLESIVHINEEVYGATRLRLEHDIDIVLEPDATILFGSFRLPDTIWLPWCDNQYEVATWVDIILTILAIIAFIVYILCRRRYTPTDADISIGFYNSDNQTK